MKNQKTALEASENGGCLPWSIISDGTKAGVIKASPGQIYGMSLGNINAAPAYLKLYDKITAPTTSDVPVYRLMIPGNTAGGGREKAWPLGLKFNTGIAWRLTTEAANNGDTAPANAEVTASGDYK